MDESATSTQSTNISGGLNLGGRRYWTPNEEELLISSLELLCNTGWKVKGVFKGGYVKELERMLYKSVPDSGIVAKHIKSKIQVWKRQHSGILAIITSSGGRGASFDYEKNMIIAETEELWETVTKINPDYGKLRGKPQPFFPRWQIIFGDDRAHGNVSFGVGDAVQELFVNSQNIQSSQPPPSNVPIPPPVGDQTILTENVSPDAEKNATCSDSNATKKKKRKVVQTHGIEAVLGNYMAESSSVLERVAEKLTSSESRNQKDEDDTVLRRSLFDAVAEFPDIELDDQIRVTRFLANNKADMDAFFGMHKEARARFVRLL